MYDENLIVVGTGIRTVGQMTPESIACIRNSDKVLYIVSDPVAEALIKDENPNAESLFDCYAENRPRMESYNLMIARTLAHVRAGHRVCMVAYGHPGVFAYPTHESIRQARAAGFKARMLPGISAEDCLFADLGIDPATVGCQSYEATDYLLYGRISDPSSHLILWQIGILGNAGFHRYGYAPRGMDLLLAKLYQLYSPYHEVVIYEAALLPGVEPMARRVPLYALPWSGVTAVATLYVPPSSPPRLDPYVAAMLAAAGG